MPRLLHPVVVAAFIGLLFAGCTKPAIPEPQPEPVGVEVPFTLTDHNVIVVSAKINDTDTLNLMLHTAAADVTLTEEAVRKSKGIHFTQTNKVKSWGGEADSRLSRGNRVRIGPLLGSNIDIREDINSGRDTDGKFGLDFFLNKIVEIDFDRRRIAVHDDLPGKVERYDRLKIDNQGGQLLIDGGCVIDGKTYSNKFLVHTGYSGGVLLDDAFAATAGVGEKIRITDESSLKDSFGNTIKVRKGVVPEFALGTTKIPNMPVGFFAGAIGTQKMSLIGCEVLVRFNLVFDLVRNDLYLSPRGN